MNRTRPVILLGCGSFNPPTNMHLRMFELARDCLRTVGFNVIEGIMSPVHDAYGKSTLISAFHRCNMVEMATKTSNWIKLNKWECEQNGWTTTRAVLEHHQKVVNEKFAGSEIKPLVKLLIGADVLESFSVPNLWNPLDIEAMVKTHGLVVVSRSGSNPESFVSKLEILSRYRENIHLVTEWVVNDIQSTKIRDAIRQNLSTKYLLQDLTPWARLS
ncbi:hypothetical protein CHUAL_010054 [Chamberlinius hualienensis]